MFQHSREQELSAVGVCVIFTEVGVVLTMLDTISVLFGKRAIYK